MTVLGSGGRAHKPEPCTLYVSRHVSREPPRLGAEFIKPLQPSRLLCKSVKLRFLQRFLATGLYCLEDTGLSLSADPGRLAFLLNLLVAVLTRSWINQTGEDLCTMSI